MEQGEIQQQAFFVFSDLPSPEIIRTTVSKL